MTFQLIVLAGLSTIGCYYVSFFTSPETTIKTGRPASALSGASVDIFVHARFVSELVNFVTSNLPLKNNMKKVTFFTKAVKRKMAAFFDPCELPESIVYAIVY